MSMQTREDKATINIATSCLNNDSISISKVVHLADIHIRLSKFHDEYNRVFNELYSQLRLLKNDFPDTLICICGDILHSKDELRPNTIFEVWKFLKHLSEIFPCIVIAGNHDVVDKNPSKVDAISAILVDRALTNIHYLKDTGVYIYNNVVFGVSSVYQKTILSCEDVNGALRALQDQGSDLCFFHKFKEKQVRIGLYHGPIAGSIQNDQGHKMSGKSIKEFGSYDVIMLGDIHRFQYLNEQHTIIVRRIPNMDIWSGP